MSEGGAHKNSWEWHRARAERICESNGVDRGKPARFAAPPLRTQSVAVVHQLGGTWQALQLPLL